MAIPALAPGLGHVSPFLGRLDDIGHDGMQLISDISEIFSVHGIETEIIAASVRHPVHVTEAARRGAHFATIPLKSLNNCSLIRLPTAVWKNSWRTGQALKISNVRS